MARQLTVDNQNSSHESNADSSQSDIQFETLMDNASSKKSQAVVAQTAKEYPSALGSMNEEEAKQEHIIETSVIKDIQDSPVSKKTWGDEMAKAISNTRHKKNTVLSVDKWSPPEELSKQSVLRLKNAAIHIRNAHRLTAYMIHTVGSSLIEAKEMLPHGSFLPWIETACGFTRKTASRYMRFAYTGIEAKNVNHLNSSTIFALSAKSVSDEIRAKVIASKDDDEAMKIIRMSKVKIYMPVQESGSEKVKVALSVLRAGVDGILNGIGSLSESDCDELKNIMTQLQKALEQKQ